MASTQQTLGSISTTTKNIKIDKIATWIERQTPINTAYVPIYTNTFVNIILAGMSFYTNYTIIFLYVPRVSGNEFYRWLNIFAELK